MIERNQHIKNIQQYLDYYPAVGLIGPRQVGKTTLAKDLLSKQANPGLYLDLELPEDLAKLSDAQLFLQQQAGRLVVLDEIQRMPELFPLLRALIDRNGHPGQYLILGSASPTLLRQSSETLAGRIHYHELRPFSFLEIGLTVSVDRLWLRGGYPRSVLAPTDALSLTWRSDFIRTFVERELLHYTSQRLPSATFLRFLEMVAHLNGQLWNASRLAKSLEVSVPTINRYRDLLVDTFILRKLPPYSRHSGKRLVKSPKVYLNDTGLLHALLNIKDTERLYAHPIVGTSWEGWVIEQIASLLTEGATLSFYRTQDGAELDLVVEGLESHPWVFEIKRTVQPRVSAYFLRAAENLKARKCLYVTAGNNRYPLHPNVEAIGVERLPELFN